MHNYDAFPDHLKSYEALAQHFRAHLDSARSTTDKGLKFALSVQKLVPQTEAGADFGDRI